MKIVTLNCSFVNLHIKTLQKYKPNSHNNIMCIVIHALHGMGTMLNMLIIPIHHFTG